MYHSGLPSDLLHRLYEVLHSCAPVSSNETLKPVFNDARIALWKPGLPETNNESDRVSQLIDYLARKQNSQGDDGLVLFLQVLGQSLAEKDSQQKRLHELAVDVYYHYHPAPRVSPGEPPYKGLEAYDDQDAHLFFGRELLTARLIHRLFDDNESNFLMVVGASGSGKSSLVKAGLVASLMRGEKLIDGTTYPPGSPHWLYFVVTPTATPLQSLAKVLTKGQLPSETAGLRERLAKDPKELALHTDKLLSEHKTPASISPRLVLIVDQFEELFTQCKDEDERRQYINNLLTATSIEYRTLVIVTARADFYEDYVRSLKDVLPKRQVNVAEMGPDELRRVITAPARLAGLQVEDVLVEAALVDLQEMGQSGGELPLLSYVLEQTWKAWKETQTSSQNVSSVLTLAQYEKVGRVKGAIAKTANETFAGLTKTQPEIARKIFLQLIELSGGAIKATRRRVARQELRLPQIDNVQVDIVIEQLMKARLLVARQESLELVHEALIDHWQQLREWVNQYREDLPQRSRLEQAAREWERNGRNFSYLYHGLQLDLADSWLKNTDLPVEQMVQVFVNTGVHARQEEEVKRWQVQKRQQLRRRSLLIAIAIILLLLGYLAPSIWSVIQNSWQKIPIPSLSATQEYLFAGTKDNGIGRSEDGKMWYISVTDLPRDEDNKVWAIWDLAINPLNSKQIFAFVSQNGLYQTMDAGVTWQPVKFGFPEDALIGEPPIDLDSYGDWASVILADYSLYISQVNKEVWQSVEQLSCPNSQLPFQSITSVQLITNYIFVGTIEGLYRSNLPYDLCLEWEFLTPQRVDWLVADNTRSALFMSADEGLGIFEPDSRIYIWEQSEQLRPLAKVNGKILVLIPHPDPEAEILLFGVTYSDKVFFVLRDGSTEYLSGVPPGATSDLLITYLPGTKDLALFLAHEDGLLHYTKPLN